MALPKQNPGKITGRSTPRDKPTSDALIDRMYRKTMAVSDPTGTKSGSKYVYVKNPAKTAERVPENSRCVLW